MTDLSLDPKKTALVAIDLQNALTGHATAPHPAAEVLKKNRQIAEALRARDGLVVWVRVDLNDVLSLPVDQPSRFTGQPMPPELSDCAVRRPPGRRCADYEASLGRLRKHCS